MSILLFFVREKILFAKKKTLLFRKCPHLCKRKLKWDFTMFVESKNQRFSVVIIKSRKLIKSLQAIRFVSKQFFNKSDISACENHMMFKLMRIFFTYFAKIKLIIIFSFRFPFVFHYPHNHCGIMCLLAFTRTLIVCFSFTRYSHAFHIFVCSMSFACALLACVPYFFFSYISYIRYFHAFYLLHAYIFTLLARISYIHCFYENHIYVFRTNSHIYAVCVSHACVLALSTFL